MSFCFVCCLSRTATGERPCEKRRGADRCKLLSVLQLVDTLSLAAVVLSFPFRYI